MPRRRSNGQEAALGLLVRLSIPGTTKEGGPNPHPAYGDQLQNRGMRDSVPAEGRAIVTYSAREVSFADGEKVNPARADRSSSRICSSASSGRTS